MPIYHSSHYPPAELEARLRLHRLPETGMRRFRTLIDAFGSASSALSAPGPAWRALGIPQATIDARRSAEVREGALAAMAWLEVPGQHLLMWDGPEYPALLAEIDDAPPLLFVAGNPALLDRPQLAIVGSRRATPPALDTARAFSRCLTQAGFTITSGLALGIDGAAHRAALEVGGARSGCSAQACKTLSTAPPRPGPDDDRHGRCTGVRVSAGCRATAWQLPRRNRIISGLSLGVLVVEASLASGSLITARLAAEQGREVYAIPGSIHHPAAKVATS